MGTPFQNPSTSPSIGDYAIVGDCRAAALISRDGSLDWLSWPRFDSEPVFAGILDIQKGGRWRIHPVLPSRTSRTYIGESNVLQTTFESEQGRATLTDLMPVTTERMKRRTVLPDHEIVRQIECVAGDVTMAVDFQPTVSYGASTAKLRDCGRLGVRMDTNAGVYWFRSSHPVQITPDATAAYAKLNLRAGDVVQFSLTFSEESPCVLPPLGKWTSNRIDATVHWWKQWAARASYEGPYRDLVVRSALALKLLTYAPSGAVVAAATTSLPERIGGSLNWDYRYCWLRDASLTVRSLLGLGYYDEADAFMNWILHATALTRPKLRILYTVFGDNAPAERELKFLAGYRDSRPVRVGNAARGQLQLDVYGEVIDAAAQYAYMVGPFDRTTQRVLKQLGSYVLKHWNEPDEGIWEPRGGRQNHAHSRLLCWAALDRLIKLHERGTLNNAPVDDYKRQRKLIASQLRQRFWNTGMNSYVSALGHASLDASLLLLSYYGFERADSERMRHTYAALRRELGERDGLIYRYRRKSPEGAFGICSFWEVEYLALGGGTLDECCTQFEQVCSFRNDVGLFAEEIDASTGAALGNFPQAFTHVGLISAALAISERARGVRQLPHREHSAEVNHLEGQAA